MDLKVVTGIAESSECIPAWPLVPSECMVVRYRQEAVEHMSTASSSAEERRKVGGLVVRLASLVAWILWGILLIGTTVWGAAALWIDGPTGRWAAGSLASLFVALCVALPFLVRRSRWMRFLSMLPFVAILGWWLSIPPSNDRDWSADVSRLPRAEIDGSKVTIHNVRSFEYRTETDYTEHWETRAYDLDLLDGVDLFLSFWGPALYGHTIMSWEFSDGQHLAVSIETRKEKGESYSAVRGFFRQYELYYVVADERDLVGVRTNHRGEEVYLYRMKTRSDEPRALLMQYLNQINRLAKRPHWYNALTYNCTTSIFHNLKVVAPSRHWDWRLVANGYLPDLAYERGNINTSMPLEALRKRSLISEAAKQADATPDFSRRIREGLPGRPAE